MSTPTPAEVRQAIWENHSAPGGLLRNARAEELVAAAEQTGDGELTHLALFALIDAYEYSTESGKMMVPFARLLQEWDRDPSGFDEQDVHSLHWRFKWVSTGMLDLPEIPLASIEKWREEMRRRYRLAGYTERAVHQSEFYLAVETGDTGRADAAFTAWCATDRDRMSDCHACELGSQGWYWTRKQNHQKAIEVWKPVLDGQLTCKEEPHRVLAKSLLSLVELGRTDEARAHHLRGYRMARGNESLLNSIGLHIEFCALTGNEARGLEILAEHAAHLGPIGDQDSQLSLAGGVLVLLGRLVALGHGERPAVPYEGTRRSVRELYEQLYADATAIALRFDARNGNAFRSGLLAERLARQPLLDALPLGVRAAVLDTGVPVSVPVAKPQAVHPVTDVRELAQEARRLRDAGHPGADAAWDRVGEVLRERGESADALLAAELLEHRAMREPGRALFEETVAAFRAAGEPGRAALNELRVAMAALQEGADPAAVRRLTEAAAASAESLDAGDPLRVRRLATVELTRIKLEAFAAREDEEADFGPAVAAFIAAYPGDDPDIADLLAEAETMLAQGAWAGRDWPRAEALLASAAGRSVAAGRPWEAVEPLSRLGSLQQMLGRAEEAEATVRTALEHSAELTDPAEIATVRLALAEALYRQDGKDEEAAGYALEAAHWFDAAGETAGAGAYARLILAQAYGELGRAAESAEVLESALPDLLQQGEEHAVRARETLGNQLRTLGDPRGAAEQFLLAAEAARGWEYQAPQARLATLAAECLAAQGMEEQALPAYERAVELWRAAGEPVQLARALRSLAWLKVSDDFSAAEAVSAAAELMGQALDAVAGEGPELLLERGRTWSQLAEVLSGQIDSEDPDDETWEDDEEIREEVLELWEKAAGAFGELGPELLADRAQCVLRMAWLDRRRGSGKAGAERLRGFADEVRSMDTTEARELLPQLENNLKHLG
ncbi:tetratricopeptide repeat protein [Streptomyces sp. NPDC050738]|uniref:tetratricopeptide repeat protein n=1 Tax=Streptomyces sp. NPDC050738 TaxID=3154744 RepID=UPI00344771AF